MKHIPPERRSTHELYEQFREAGERKARANRAVRRRTWIQHVPGPALGAVLAFLVVGAGVALGTKVFATDDGPTIKSDPGAGQLGRAAQDRHVAQAVADDPGTAGAQWGVRVYTSDGGRTCITAGRLVGGRIGLVNDGQFEAYGAGVPGTCNDLSRYHAASVVRRYVAGSDRRAVLFGVVDRTVTGLALGRDGDLQPVPVAPDGTYIVVRSGRRAFAGQHLEVARAGETRQLPVGPG